MLLEIISPDKKLFSGEVRQVLVPGSKGSFEILSSHAPIISSLDKGKLSFLAADGKRTTFEIDGGVVEAKNNKIIVLAENAK